MYFRYKPLSRSFASIKGLSATIGKFYAYTSIPFRTLVTVHFTSPASSCTLTLNSIALVHLWQPAATYRYLSLSTLHFHTYTRSLVCFEKLRKTIYQNLTVHSWFRTFQGIYFSPHHWTQYIYEFSSNDGALCALDTEVSTSTPSFCWMSGQKIPANASGLENHMGHVPFSQYRYVVNLTEGSFGPCFSEGGNWKKHEIWNQQKVMKVSD